MAIMFPMKWPLPDAPPAGIYSGGMNSLEMLLSNDLLADPQSRGEKSPTAQLLEDLNCRMVHRIATHDWTHQDLTEFISDDYRAYLEYQETPYSVGRDNYITNYRTFVDANPEYYLEPVCTVADVHENNNTAAVWMLLRVSGHPVGVQRESVTVVHWRRRAGKWQAYKQNGIRGAGGSF